MAKAEIARRLSVGRHWCTGCWRNRADAPASDLIGGLVKESPQNNAEARRESPFEMFLDEAENPSGLGRGWRNVDEYSFGMNTFWQKNRCGIVKAGLRQRFGGADA